MLIVEVLSPSNECETWESIRACSTLASLQGILVPATDARHAQVYGVASRALSPEAPDVTSNSGDVKVADLDFTVPIAELYAGTKLAEQSRPIAKLPSIDCRLLLTALGPLAQ